MPKVDIWMPMYIGDYLGDTIELTAEEHGAYLLLLMHYWLKKGEIGNDVERLARVCKTNIETCSFILGYYFTLENGAYKNKRADEEMANAESRRVASAENGRKGGRPGKKNLEETRSFTVGNLEKSSSSSSSSSSTNTDYNNIIIPEESGFSFNPNDVAGSFEKVRSHWNSKSELPNFSRLFMNLFPKERDSFMVMLSHGVDALCLAIDHYSILLSDPVKYGFDVKYAYKSLPGFLQKAENYLEEPKARASPEAKSVKDYTKYNALMRKE